jgi:hypothetical protein
MRGIVIVAALAVAAPAWADEPTQPGTETKSSGARAELVVLETLNGLGVGVEVCILAECGNARPWAAALMLGTGAGIAGSLLLTSGGITSGQGQLVETGTLWGFWNGIAIAGVADFYDRDSATPATATVLAGQLGGTLIGAGLTQVIHPTGGQVALAGAVGFWTGVEAALILGAADTSMSAQAVFGVLLASSDAGLLGGAFLADRYPMSRGRVLLIDVGGLAGGLAGGGIAILIGGDHVGQTVGFTSEIIGTVTGLAIATLLTRNWDPPAPAAHVMLVPTRGGVMGSLSMAW